MKLTAKNFTSIKILILICSLATSICCNGAELLRTYELPLGPKITNGVDNYLVYSTTDYELGLVTAPIVHGKTMFGTLVRPARNGHYDIIGTTTNSTFTVYVYKDDPQRFWCWYVDVAKNDAKYQPDFFYKIGKLITITNNKPKQGKLSNK